MSEICVYCELPKANRISEIRDGFCWRDEKSCREFCRDMKPKLDEIARLTSELAAATSRAEAAEAKVRDVETLDEWATRENYVRYGTNYDGQGLCVLVRGLKGDKMFYAVTLDAARAAAAQWVRENSPPQKKPTDEGGRGE